MHCYNYNFHEEVHKMFYKNWANDSSKYNIWYTLEFYPVPVTTSRPQKALEIMSKVQSYNRRMCENISRVIEMLTI